MQCFSSVILVMYMSRERTEELLGTTLLNNLDQTGLQLLNRGNVVGKDTHLTALGGDVDLDDFLRLVDRLDEVISTLSSTVASGGYAVQLAP